MAKPQLGEETDPSRRIRHRKLRELAVRGSLAVSTLVATACEEKAKDIPSAEYTLIKDATLASINRTASFWSYRYDQLGIDRATVPDLRLEYDDDEVNVLCDVFTVPEEGEMFFCNVDGKMVVNPKAVRNLVLYVGLDPDNPEDLSAVTDIVTAHEFGHFLQRLRGDQRDVFTLEQQADCLAGAQLAVESYGHESGEQGIADALARYLQTMSAIGGDPDHGTGEQRMQSFMAGYSAGIAGCDTL